MQPTLTSRQGTLRCGARTMLSANHNTDKRGVASPPSQSQHSKAGHGLSSQPITTLNTARKMAVAKAFVMFIVAGVCL